MTVVLSLMLIGTATLVVVLWVMVGKVIGVRRMLQEANARHADMCLKMAQVNLRAETLAREIKRVTFENAELRGEIAFMSAQREVLRLQLESALSASLKYQAGQPVRGVAKA